MGASLAHDYGGWVPQNRFATGESPAFIKWLGFAAGAAFTAAIGTGENYHSLEHFQRLASPKSFVASEYEIAPAKLPRTPKQDLERIREVLKPSISNLAEVFGVSRQSIYNWLNGDKVTSDYVAKLQDLAEAADVLAFAGVRVDSNLLKRRFQNGKSLMQIAKAGESVRNAATALVQIVNREAIQRARMDARFAKRAKSTSTADFDFPQHNDIS